MHPKNRYSETGIIGFTLNLFLIVLLSIILSAFTGGGWSAISLLFIGVPFSFACFLVLLLIAYGVKSIALKSLVWVDKYMVYFMIFTQTFITIFNVGGCGDSPNKIGNFIQRIVTNSPECYDYSLNPWIPEPIVLGLYGFNLILLAVFTIKTISSAHQKSI